MEIEARCPFCGEEEDFETVEVFAGPETWGWLVECLCCTCRGPIASSIKGAIEAWNRRAV